MPNAFSDPETDLKLALTGLQAVLGIIASIRAQSGMTNDQVLVHARTVTAGNDVQYQALVAALNL